jgi:predicted nucleic acid-binding protein
VLESKNRQNTYLFDVGVIALSHAHTPVSGPAFDYLKAAIKGEIIGIIPNTAVLGAHHVLRNNYHIKNSVASDLLRNLQTARSLEWHETVSFDTITAALRTSGEANIEAWDAYYAEVAEETGTDLILTLDDDFERVGVNCEVILEESEFEELSEFMEDLDGIRTYKDLDHEYV